MTAQEAKARLEQIKWLDEEIKTLHQELQYLREGIFQSSRLTDTRVQTSKVNQTDDHIIQNIKSAEDIERRIGEVIKIRLGIINTIDKLGSSLDRTVLRMFYVNHLEAWEIGEKLHKSNSTIYHIRKEAIERLAAWDNS